MIRSATFMFNQWSA